jgi:Zn-dependent protease
MDLTQFFTIIVLIFSVVIHEVSHGFMALFFGDATAKYAGRLTLNPIRHVDILGSIIIPLILVLLPGGFVIGWAKPVPYNPYNLSNRRWGEFWVASAGPISNIIIGTVFAFLVRFGSFSPTVNLLMFTIVIINFSLALFNMIPIYPLDGSKILLNILPTHLYQKTFNFMQRWGLLLAVLFIFVLWTPLSNLMFKFLIYFTQISF